MPRANALAFEDTDGREDDLVWFNLILNTYGLRLSDYRFLPRCCVAVGTVAHAVEVDMRERQRDERDKLKLAH